MGGGYPITVTFVTFDSKEIACGQYHDLLENPSVCTVESPQTAPIKSKLLALQLNGGGPSFTVKEKHVVSKSPLENILTGNIFQYFKINKEDKKTVRSRYNLQHADVRVNY